MGLKKDYSVVADSVMSSSSSPSASPMPVKRAAITYGRRREESDNSFSYSEQDSRDSIYRTGPPDILDEVPPSEPSRLDSDDDAEEDADGDILPSILATGFGWKEKMKQIDDEDDLSSYLDLQNAGVCDPSQGDAQMTVDTDVESPVKGAGTRTTKGVTAVGSSFSSLTSPSDSATSPATATTSRNRPRLSKNIITSDDDMDQNDKRGTHFSSPETSPLHPIATPKSQPTTSPPTSHHDDVSANSAASSASKGKGKASKARHTVAPLRFDSPPPEDSDNENTMRSRKTQGRREKKQKVKVNKFAPVVHQTLTSCSRHPPKKRYRRPTESVPE